jgi:hypothetical protein
MTNQTGVGVPVQFQPIAPISLSFGAAHQLTPVLLDVTGAVQTPTLTFTYKSSNPSLVTVDADGLCTVANPDPTTLPPGGQVQITINYPWAGNTIGNGQMIYTTVAITVLAGSVISAWVPQAPGFDLEWCENNMSGTPHGAGWKVIAAE